MFEHMTYENILSQALSNISNEFDKREGSVIYDAIAPICAVLAQAYIDLGIAIKEGFADTCSREYLIKRAKERGLSPYESTKSIVLANLTGNFNLSGGERFSCNDLNFAYTGEIESGYYKLECETTGVIGNISYGTLLPIDNIQGLETAEIVSIFSSAIDEEDTEAFRQRYFDSFESQAFGGNRADYKNKLLSLNENSEISGNGGIGGIKIYRTPDGGGTVEIVITNNSYNVPTNELILLVQEVIDPVESQGGGYGIAPIGHNVTITPVNATTINISTTVTLKSGFQLNDVLDYIKSNVELYLQELRETWENGNTIIRISRIESAILGINGIIDIVNTTINGVAENLEIDEHNVPVIGGVTVAVN